MSYQATVYKVMIASPGDVAAERNIIREILNEWNTVHSEKMKIVLLPVGWETHSSPEMGGTPQSVINKQILNGSDILIGVFWTRAGTPTEQYMSGTIEEIEEHIQAGKPAMLYFSSAPVMPDSVDPEQYKKLKEFKESCKTRGLFESYSDASDFRNKFYRQIQLKMNEDQYSEASKTGNTSAIVQSNLSNTPALSKEAATLLKDAASDPYGQIMFLRHLGGVTMGTNNKQYLEGSDPRLRAIWEGALEELEHSNLIRAVSSKREMFRLTREGYDVAELVNP
ncbi:DUF4062 domain-containing protein [Burkholderia multivorans]|uniref:DUF4062 domain-containing protein n=1 Tax=Burkholderia multivorans TaxID=87883 RepID=UPI001C250575|nr:DUF4062 domain-containing protein [Burkholderia multivorans]MBU9262855.1 DUF4062 domain-containing protein [Burkholderia multivorans]